MGGYRATPQEVGIIRREIRTCMRLIKEQGTVLMNTIMKCATLDDESWRHVMQRLRPAEQRMIMRECQRDYDGRPLQRHGEGEP